MAGRYFVDCSVRSGRVVLAGREAHHLLHVMRAAPGTEVVLFDGTGVEFTARVERRTRSQVELAVIERREVDRELPWVVTLGVSLPKGERQKWLVEKMVELGLTRLVPLFTARSVAEITENALDRLRRGVVEASKQCGRNRLMEVSHPQHWPDYVASTGPSACRWLADPRGTAELPETLTAFGGAPRDVFLAVGPEGGFSKEEVALAAEAGWQTLKLGPRILRVETAAVLLVAWASRGR